MIIKAGNFTIEGISIGGIEVSIAIQELDLTFDIGRCTKRSVRSNNLAISHAHADHLGAIGSYLSIRDLFGMSRCRIYIPEDLAVDVENIIKSFEKLQKKTFDYELVKVRHKVLYPLNRDHILMPFNVFHILPSMGYTVFHKTTKLKSEFIGMSQKEIIRLKNENPDRIFYKSIIPVVTYSADTTINVVEKYDFVRESKVLIIETTFIDEKKDIEKSQLGKHIHLEELLKKIHLLKNEHIILSHFSQIYKKEKIQEIINERLKGEDRIQLLLFEDDERI